MQTPPDPSIGNLKHRRMFASQQLLVAVTVAFVTIAVSNKCKLCCYCRVACHKHKIRFSGLFGEDKQLVALTAAVSKRCTVIINMLERTNHHGLLPKLSWPQYSQAAAQYRFHSGAQGPHIILQHRSMETPSSHVSVSCTPACPRASSNQQIASHLHSPCLQLTHCNTCPENQHTSITWPASMRLHNTYPGRLQS